MSDKKKLLENFSALAFMQILNYLLPFITLPYLVRVLGPEKYGVYIFSQAFVQYFMIIVDFGFDLSASREISINRHNKEKLNEIVSSILGIKVILSIISFCILVLAVTLVPTLREYWTVHIFTFGFVLGNMLLTLCFYQGIERMKFITIFNASAKIIFTISIFIFVKNENDLIIAPLLNSLGYILVGISSIIVMKKVFHLRLQLPSIKEMKYHFQSSLEFFWSRLAVSFYTTSNIFVVGLALGPTAAGIFGSADKLFKGMVSLYSPLNSVLYP
ncbi:oligosaccharide flippase family protein, partial [Peribacillus frigoritolerans]